MLSSLMKKGIFGLFGSFVLLLIYSYFLTQIPTNHLTSYNGLDLHTFMQNYFFAYDEEKH